MSRRRCRRKAYKERRKEFRQLLDNNRAIVDIIRKQQNYYNISLGRLVASADYRGGIRWILMS